MAWNDAYISGSFRGVPFYTRDARATGGRRLVEHVYPERDDSEWEDLGRRNKTFSFSVYVLGDEYFNDRHNLIDALDEEGPGTLIHPYWGDFLVRVQSWNCVESWDEGRIARFSITFVRVEDIFLTVAAPSAFDVLASAKGNFLNAALSALETAYDVVTGPVAILQDAVDVGNQIVDVVYQAKKITGAYEEYQAKIDAIKGQMSEIVVIAGAIGNDLLDIIDFGTDTADPLTLAISTADAAKTQYNELKAVSNLKDDIITRYPSIADVEPTFPPLLLQKFASRVALGSRAGLVGSMTLDNASQADDVSREVGDQVKAIEDDPSVPDELYAAARDLRVAVANVLQERELTLAQLDTVQLVEFEPSLVLTWQRYKSLDREEDILGLNSVLDPGFIPAGIDLEVPRG